MSMVQRLDAIRERIGPGAVLRLADLRDADLAQSLCADLAYLLRLVEAANKLLEYAQHDQNCTSARCSQGEPTPDGGYRQMFAGKWYRTRPNPEPILCECGLRQMLETYTHQQEAT